MSVYFIQAGRYFKIGFSDDAERRFQNLHKSGTRYTFPVDAPIALGDRTLYKVVEGSKSDEWQIHSALNQFDVGLEWFLDEPPLRQFIDDIPIDCRRLLFPEVVRDGGWCEGEYHIVQRGRAAREVARYQARRSA